MALLHEASLTPTKLELLAAWLPGRDWYPGTTAPGALVRVGACRFDDPAGEVGVETIVVRAGDGPLLHTPLTYRSAPLPGAEPWLLGTAEHSVLGTRWVYDACADPVYVAAVAAAIRAGTGEAEEFVETPDGAVRREPLMSVRGSAGGPAGAARLIRTADGDPTVITTDGGVLTVRRILTAPEPGADAGPVLTGTWTGLPSPVVLATLA
jgi:hypothetical protein